MKSGVTFTDTCEPIDLPCTVGDLYVDPCNCTTYYQCYQAYSDPLLRHCATGTAWNDDKSNCDAEEKVYINGICEKYKPWNRCERIYDLSDVDITRVRDNCVDVILDGGGEKGQPTDNTGDIVGGIIGGLVLLTLIIVIIVLVKRWKGKNNFLRRFTGGKQPVDNPAYSEPYELYDTIDAVNMRESQKTTGDRPQVSTRPIITLPYKEQQLAASRPVSTISNKPNTSLQYDNIYDVTESYSPMVTPRNSEIRDYENLCTPRKHIPSEYSRPYMESTHQLPVPVSKDNVTSRSDVAVPCAHEYVDFGHYDTDYSLATDVDKCVGGVDKCVEDVKR